MEAMTNAFEEKSASRSDRDARRDRPTVPAPPPTSAHGSIADEIDRLRALRESGALSEEQYARAVDRVIGGEGKAG
jgi:hypothetical protein